METIETSDIEVPSLNHDCLEHLFQFVEPKDWPAFMRVCKSWKLAANNRFLKLSFFFIDDENDELEKESMSFAEFKNILKFIAPQLRYANIQICNYRFEEAFIRFGHFEYKIREHVDGTQIYELMDIIANETENIQTFKIDTFDAVTEYYFHNVPMDDWENFFRVNPVTTFKSTMRSEHDIRLFFERFISILPNSLERICIHNMYTTMVYATFTTAERRALLKFLGRLPRITKLKLIRAFVAPTSRLLRILSKHISSLTELHLEYCVHEWSNVKKSPKILTVIPNCINLTNLKLMGDVTVEDDLCRRIVANCQFIRRLSLFPWDELSKGFVVDEKYLKTLLSLPNLEELRISYTNIPLATEVKKLKKLFLDCSRSFSVDYDNLADALALMPCLSSLTLERRVECPLPVSAARRIKHTIHSRSQNIVLYSQRDVNIFIHAAQSEFIKVAEIPCNAQPLKGEFAFFYDDYSDNKLMTLTEV